MLARQPPDAADLHHLRIAPERTQMRLEQNALGAPTAPADRLDVRQLQGRLAAREARIGVIGLGYVGLPLAVAMADVGFRVLGLDIDRAKIEALSAGRSYLASIGAGSIAELRRLQRLEASDEMARVAEMDAVVICVPTPLGEHREPDLSFVVSTAEAIAPHLRPGQLVILESTTYPGTTREVLKPILERSGLRSEDDLFLAYSPEREDPGNADFTTGRIPKVVSGDGACALTLALTLYDQFVVRTVPVSSPAVAEAVKLTENVFRAVNIALANELKVVLDAMGIDVWEVIDAASTKPFGFMPFYPGPGLGGHCIPIDPFYLTWKAREHDVTSRFIELAGEINTAMPQRVVDRLARALDQRFAKGLNGAAILLMGIAYKKNVGDVRESPALTIIDLLEERGATTAFADPRVPVVPMTRRHGRLAGRRSIDFDDLHLREFDAVVIVTDHDEFDYETLTAEAKLVLDTRNATRRVQKHRDRIVLA